MKQDFLHVECRPACLLLPPSPSPTSALNHYPRDGEARRLDVRGLLGHLPLSLGHPAVQHPGLRDGANPPLSADLHIHEEVCLAATFPLRGRTAPVRLLGVINDPCELPLPEVIELDPA